MTPSYEFLHALELEIADRLAAARLEGWKAGVEAAGDLAGTVRAALNSEQLQERRDMLAAIRALSERGAEKG